MGSANWHLVVLSVWYVCGSIITVVFWDIFSYVLTDPVNDVNQVELNSQSMPVSVETDGLQEGKQWKSWRNCVLLILQHHLTHHDINYRGECSTWEASLPRKALPHSSFEKSFCRHHTKSSRKDPWKGVLPTWNACLILIHPILGARFSDEIIKYM